MLNWALAPQILPEQEGAGQSFYIMIPAIHIYGQAIPQGGSQEDESPGQGRFRGLTEGIGLVQSDLDVFIRVDVSVAIRADRNAIL